MLLELEAVSKSFDGLAAVSRVSLSVPEGQILGLIGPNGAGKTTLFNLITGAHFPTNGRITFNGRDITNSQPHERCWRGVARTFQLARPFGQLSVLDNVAIGRVYGREAARSRGQAETEAMSVLAKVGLERRASATASTLTAAERKKLELARALAARPRLLLLDELLAGLSQAEAADALALIGEMRSQGMTVIMVEHLVKALFGVADRVAVLNAGELIADGPPDEIARLPPVIDAYLGTALHADVA